MRKVLYLCSEIIKNDANMAREDIVQKWLDHVHEDVSAAEDLHKTGHQLYVDG